MAYWKAETWRRQWHPTPVLLPGKSHGWRNLVGCSPWGRWESDRTERLHFHFSLSCIGEGNGNPLQCSCLENPRDSGAWWAAISGVAQSWTRLKRLSSSSSKCGKDQGTLFWGTEYDKCWDVPSKVILQKKKIWLFHCVLSLGSLNLEDASCSSGDRNQAWITTTWTLRWECSVCQQFDFTLLRL